VEEVSHDLDLARNLSQVLRVEAALVHDLDGDMRAGQPVHAESDDGEVALAQQAGLQIVQADPEEPEDTF
jgi:hypothetical protein